MSEPRFHAYGSGLSLRQLVDVTGAVAQESADAGRHISGIAALDQAGPRDLAFLDNARYAEQLRTTRAGICLTTARLAELAPRHTAVLVTPKPYLAFVTAARTLFPAALRPAALYVNETSGTHASATVHATARIEADVRIEPGAIVGAGAEIGSGTIVTPGAVIGAGVRIGRGCTIGSGATISHSLIGDRVIVHPGCRIGQDGFGYVLGDQHVKVPQVGRVIIQDDVEIGANTTIDRGAIRDTVIGEGSKIDNLVQIGHNVVVGRHCVIVAQTGLAGSTTLGDHVVLGARVGTNNHVTIGEGAQIAAISIVNDDVPPGARWGGTPAKPVRLWFREMKLLEQLARKEAPRSAGAAGDGPSED